MPHRETRKILKAGQRSFAVTLPISWVKFFKLKAGDDVEVISNGRIIITPKKSKVEKK